MSVRNLVNSALQKGKIQQIEHLYDKDHFESIEADPNFVNQGDHEFAKGREVWRQPLDEDELKTQSDPNTKTARVTTEIDIDYVATQLSRYKDFSSQDGSGVPLELMAELLQTSWIEAPTI